MINRDGANKSLWQDVPEFRPARDYEDLVYDVAIIGGGISGISTGLLLQKAGKRCIICEAENLCFGTSGGTTAHLNTVLDTPYSMIIKNFGLDNARLVRQAAEQAIDLIKSNIKEYAIECEFEDAEAYLFAQNEKETEDLEEIYQSALKVGLTPEYSESLPIDAAYEAAIVIGGQAKFHPVKYVHALARSFEKQGGIIVEHCRMSDYQHKIPIEVVTNKGTILCHQLVLATHTPPGLNRLNFRCAPYRSYAMALELNDEAYPEGLIYDLEDPYHYYRSQTIDGRQYLIAGGADHKTGHTEDTEECFTTLKNYFKKIFDIKEVSHQWSSQYFETPDGLPYIGLMPGVKENIFTGAGYGGNGMIYSSVAAIMLRDMLCGNSGSPLVELFSPSRHKPVAAFASFVRENADSAKEFFSKFLPAEQLKELSTIAHGKGKLVKFDGETMAVSRADDGKIHALNPICPHMSCSVRWNTTEKTWDCPCHGARYSGDGTVLTCPSTANLKQIDIRE